MNVKTIAIPVKEGGSYVQHFGRQGMGGVRSPPEAFLRVCEGRNVCRSERALKKGTEQGADRH